MEISHQKEGIGDSKNYVHKIDKNYVLKSLANELQVELVFNLQNTDKFCYRFRSLIKDPNCGIFLCVGYTGNFDNFRLLGKKMAISEFNRYLAVCIEVNIYDYEYKPHIEEIDITEKYNKIIQQNEVKRE